MATTSEFKNPVQNWLVELAKEAGLDISGFKHKVTQEFKNHTLSHHGNAKSEDSRGQIAVTESDLSNIDEIIENPTFAVAGVKRRNKYGKLEDRIILVKNTNHGTILFEEVLSGKKNKALNAKSLMIKKGVITEESLRHILESNSKNDISGFKIKYADAVAANSTIHSVQTTDGGSNLRPRSSIDSSIADSANLSN